MKKFVLFIILICILLPIHAFSEQEQNKRYPVAVLTGHQGRELFFITNFQNILDGSPLSDVLSAAADNALSEIVFEYCKSKGFDSKFKENKQKNATWKIASCNMFDSLVNSLKKLTPLDTYVPKYKIETKTQETKTTFRIDFYTKPEMTLIEKEKYPIIMFIEKYSAKIVYEGQEEKPFLFKREGSFNGKIVLDTDVLIELKNSNTLELIDRIEFKKKYESKPVNFKGDVPFLGSPKILTDNRKEPLLEILEQFYNDFLRIFQDYDWETAFRFVGKRN